MDEAFVWLLVVVLLAIPFTLWILGAFTHPGPFAVWVSMSALITAMVDRYGAVLSPV